ncbi:putative nucleolar protein 16 [Amylocarpus encephaloides]|uniref:Nucleolar protein 16 n=1 Tax=Amylocarpus encephaloides TaxID=45428 RepID=A0A9P7YET5_9HELO|nr:putative nucleolar protein 16 [Amylocarpus encephaloides]
MGRELQKKKRRSSIRKVRMKPKSKRVNVLSNPIIAANWNSKETLSQNYRRLGLTSRLNSATGGIEKLRPGAESSTSTTSKLAISNAIPKQFAPTEATVERDPETGRILRVIHPHSRPNPLNDPLNSDSEDEMVDEGEEFEGFDGQAARNAGKGQNEIVKQLEEMASRAPEKKERKQSEREQEWIERLVGKYGEDYKRMSRDMKLNPMQQTEADIKKRVGKWKTSSGHSASAISA